jgi:hypothetical protein
MAILTGFPMCNTLHVGGPNPDCPQCGIRKSPLFTGSASAQTYNKDGMRIFRGKFQEAFPGSFPGRIYSEEVFERLADFYSRKN